MVTSHFIQMNSNLDQKSLEFYQKKFSEIDIYLKSNMKVDYEKLQFNVGVANIKRKELNPEILEQIRPEINIDSEKVIEEDKLPEKENNNSSSYYQIFMFGGLVVTSVLFFVWKFSNK